MQKARKSVVYATGFIGYFYLIIAVIGLGAIVFLANSPETAMYYWKSYDGSKLFGGANMAAIPYHMLLVETYS